MKTQSISYKVIRNILFNITGKIWFIIVTIFLTPFIIKYIGIERYGAWTIICIITGYFSLLDFGIGAGFIKYIAEYKAKNNNSAINEVINTGFISYVLFGIIIVFFGILLENIIFQIFKIPLQFYDEASFVYVTALLIFAGTNIFSVFSTIQSGLQRMDITNKISIFSSILNIIGTIYFLKNGYGLSGLLVNNFIIFIIVTIINIIISYKIFPELKLNPIAYIHNKKMFKQLFSFGSKLQLSRISALITTQIDKLFIGYFLSISLVTFYQLGSSVIQAVVSFGVLLASALTPAFTEVEAKGERNLIVKVYNHATKYISFIIIPFFFFLIISANNIMYIWMGERYDTLSGSIIRLLAAGFMIQMIAQVGYSMCIAIDKPQFIASGSIITLFLNLLLSFIAVKFLGFPWIALGTSIAVITGTTYFIFKLNKTINISFNNFINTIMPFIFNAAFCCIFAFLTEFFLKKYVFLLQSRIDFIIILFLQGIIFSTIYLILVYYLKLLNKEDWIFIKNRFNFLRA